MAPPLTTPAQQAAAAQAQLFVREGQAHRSAVNALSNSRPGMCMAGGWDVSYETLNGDFDFDSPVVQRLLQGSEGPVIRAAPPPPPVPSPAGAPSSGPSALQSYLFPASPTAPAGSPERLTQELPGTVYGPGNVLGNSTSALAGALQASAERDIAKLLRDGVRSILERQATRVPLAPNIELYNSAQGRQAPRVRLRVRGLPLKVVRQAVPTTGGAVTQWRVNGPQTQASLRVRGMSAQQLRNAAVMAGEQRLPGMLRFATGHLGGGVLAFAPSLALDYYSSVETDLRTGQSHLNAQAFVEASARSQSGNAIGFFGAMGAVALVGGAVAGAPLVLVGLAVGISLQLIWNSSGMADKAGDLAKSAMQ